MSKPETRRHLVGNVLIVCCVEIKIMYKKCDAFKILGIVRVNLLTCSSPVEFDADGKSQKFEKCFA